MARKQRSCSGKSKNQQGPPPPGFEAYKKNAASGGVVEMIGEIISDAKAMEGEAIRSEEDAEDFVKATNASFEAKSKEIVNKSEEKAKAEKDLVETKEAKEVVMLALEQAKAILSGAKLKEFLQAA